MDNGHAASWSFAPNPALETVTRTSVRAMMYKIMDSLDPSVDRPIVPLSQGDPANFSCFRTSPVAEDAVVAALRSAEYNCYPPTAGIEPARRAVADHLSRDLPYKLSPSDVYITAGCAHAIETVISVLARPGANILLPRPGYPVYEARTTFCGLEARHFDLVPERGWEVDLDAVSALADRNTVAMVVVNPGNPCGNVFTRQHLAKVAETARKLRIMVVADEVYGHLTFGSNPFVPMGVFGATVPVITVGSISKRWAVPGWRCGWIVTTDPNGVLKQTKIVDGIRSLLTITTDPVTFIQGAIPHILQNTSDEFFKETIDILRQTSSLCFDKIKEIDCITCPNKPDGSMFVMAKLDLSCLENIHNDIDFCSKLAKEEAVIILPGCVVGLKNWLRITFATDPAALEDGLDRLISFCQRHRKQKNDAGNA